MVRLWLQDYGQDFLYFDVEVWTTHAPDEPDRVRVAKIVGCGPCQAFVWIGKYVVSTKLKPRAVVRLRNGPDTEIRRLNYKITKVEPLPATPLASAA